MKKLIFTVCLCAVLLCAHTAYAISAFEFSASTAENAKLAQGDAVGYTVELASPVSEDAALHVLLSAGLTLDMQSLRVVNAQGQPKQADPIFGNDGFILLGEQLEKGDSITFSATVNSSGALDCSAELAGETHTLSHTAQQAQVASASETTASATALATAQPERDGIPAWPWVLLCTLLALGVFGAAMIINKRRRAARKRRARQNRLAAEEAEQAATEDIGQSADIPTETAKEHTDIAD